MDTNMACPKCGRELSGAIESAWAAEGDYVFVVKRETSDCNWTRCDGCKDVSCKACRKAQPIYCCEVGRIIDHERARQSLIHENPNQKMSQKEEELCPITRSST
jgi:hypothetical protein